jgi:hypothetical protein
VIVHAELQEAPVDVHATAGAAVVEEAADSTDREQGVVEEADSTDRGEAAEEEAAEEAAGADVKAAAERSRSHQNRTQRAILANPRGVLAPLEVGGWLVCRLELALLY